MLKRENAARDGDFVGRITLWGYTQYIPAGYAIHAPRANPLALACVSQGCIRLRNDAY